MLWRRLADSTAYNMGLSVGKMWQWIEQDAREYHEKSNGAFKAESDIMFPVWQGLYNEGLSDSAVSSSQQVEIVQTSLTLPSSEKASRMLVWTCVLK